MLAIPELDRRGLREFGLVTGGIIAGLFGLLLPWLLDHAFPIWPWVIFGVLAAWGLIAPSTLRPVYRGWMRFGQVLSRITTPIIMGLIFFVMIAPIALFMRLLGWDAMARRFDPEAKSYRVPTEKAPTGNLEKPF